MENHIYYKVKGRLLDTTKVDELNWHIIEKGFKHSSPLVARENALEYFGDIQKMLQENGRLSKSKNPIIIEPDFVEDLLKLEIEAFAKVLKSKPSFENDEFLNKGLEMHFFKSKLQNEYLEYLSLYLIIDREKCKDIPKEIIDINSVNNNLLEYINNNELGILIHHIPKFYVDQQGIINNLEMCEIPILEHFNCNLENVKKQVYHFGEDYVDSGFDEESGAGRIILPTPMNWDSLAEFQAEEAILSAYKDENITEEEKELENAEHVELVISQGESKKSEFKPSIVYNFKTKKAAISVKQNVAKAIAALLNTDGGIVYVGVKDDSTIGGLDYDYSVCKGNGRDGFKLEVDDLLSQFFKPWVSNLIEVNFINIKGKDIALIRIEKAGEPVFLISKYDNYKYFYYRSNASSREIIDVEEIVVYILNRYKTNDKNN